MLEVQKYVNIIEKNLEIHVNKEYAEKANAYLLNQFKLLGIYTPKRKDAIKEVLKVNFSKKELIELTNILYRKEHRDFKYVAISILNKNIKLLTTEDLPWIKELILMEPWWETVDSFAPIVGKIIKYKQDIMNDWITDENKWIRRIAIIHQLGWKKETNVSLLMKFALSQSSEKDFFIRKAIGWAFRDYARYDPIFVKEFMFYNKNNFSNLTFKEALKRVY